LNADDKYPDYISFLIRERLTGETGHKEYRGRVFLSIGWEKGLATGVYVETVFFNS
jgi:hypothetical protein